MSCLQLHLCTPVCRCLELQMLFSHLYLNRHWLHLSEHNIGELFHIIMRGTVLTDQGVKRIMSGTKVSN